MLNFYRKMGFGAGGKQVKACRERIQACPGFSSYPSVLLIPHHGLFSETSWSPISKIWHSSGVGAGRELRL